MSPKFYADADMWRFLKDQKGVVSVEFALCAIVFFSVFVMSFEVCRIQVASMLLERCVKEKVASG